MRISIEQLIQQLRYHVCEAMKQPIDIFIENIIEKPTMCLEFNETNKDCLEWEKRAQRLIDFLRREDTKAKEPNNENREVASNKQQRWRQVISQYPQASKKLWSMILQAWGQLKNKAQTVIGPNAYSEMLVSTQQFNMLFPALLVHFQKAELSIEGISEKVLLKARGAISISSEKYIKILNYFLLIRKNISLVVHQNTDEKHHLSLYENFDVLSRTVLLSRVPQSSWNGSGLWFMDKSFIDRVKEGVLGLSFDRIPAFFREAVIQSGSSFIKSNPVKIIHPLMRVRNGQVSEGWAQLWESYNEDFQSQQEEINSAKDIILHYDRDYLQSYNQS